MSLIQRFLQIGALPDEEESARLRRRSMMALISAILLLTPIWIGTYLLLRRPISAAVPAAYVFITLAALALLARTRRYDLFLAVQISLFLVLPIALQWSLGGFERGSAVALWAFGAPLGALIAWGHRPALWVFLTFAGLIAISALAEPTIRAGVLPLPAPVEAGFWALNVIAPLTTAFLRLAYFIRERDRLAARSEELLLNILPATVARRLKDGSALVADRFDEASVLFADIVDFTPFAERTAPERVVELLSSVFSTLDDLAELHGLEKIKTLGDGYLAVAGLTAVSEQHALTAARMALDIGPALRAGVGADWPDLRVRIGISSGPLIAGVIGRKRFSYDLWGDTVNTASRMAALAEPGSIAITETTAMRLGDLAMTERRAAVEVKGKGLMTTYRLLAITPPAPAGR